ncbi:hypothetical protein LTR09_007283 [Extremus antarcticus]|uniref:Heterokaryon incompatibility domain-containing protein n=1 Tax=Extremus antarcticus TaxID=702011 RepID=A0AAJ0DJK2_9PEZI|nr:hypothetical protein LTR09_007283 [Extremus antarcticus]
MPVKYRKLPKDHIRLLEFWRNDNGEPRYLVWTGALHELPPYIAVSYRYGDGKPNQRIFLDGQPIDILANLWLCLFYLRQFPGCRYVWLDYICINQQDVAERNSQVHLMDKIYAKAAHVAVWLGLDIQDDYSERELSQIHGVSDIGDVIPGGVAALATQSYWTRMWVIQEFLLAQNVLVFCGPYYIEWRLLKRAILRLLDLPDDAAVMPFLHQETAESTPSANSLRVLLLQCRNSQCHAPRDRIYSMLSLVYPEERRLLSKFFPNYHLSLTDVVTIALAHFGRGGSKLEWDDVVLDIFGFQDKAERRRVLIAAARFDVNTEAAKLNEEVPSARRTLVPSFTWQRWKPAIFGNRNTPPGGGTRGSEDKDEDEHDFIINEDANDPDVHTDPIDRSFADLRWQIQLMGGKPTHTEVLVQQFMSLVPRTFKRNHFYLPSLIRSSTLLASQRVGHTITQCKEQLTLFRASSKAERRRKLRMIRKRVISLPSDSYRAI